jgi:hypothetical protein
MNLNEINLINKIQNDTGIKVKMSKKLLSKRLIQLNKKNKELYEQKKYNLLKWIINTIESEEEFITRNINAWYLIFDKIFKEFILIKLDIKTDFEADFINSIVNELYNNNYIYECYNALNYLYNEYRNHIFFNNFNNFIINKINDSMIVQNWINWLISSIKDSSISWNDIFNTLANKCNLLHHKILKYSSTFYDVIFTELYVNGYIYDCKKALSEYYYYENFDKYYYYRNLDATNGQLEDLPATLKFYNSFTNTIRFGLEERLSSKIQFNIGYTGYLLFRKYNFNDRPKEIDYLISNFLLDTKYKIK